MYLRVSSSTEGRRQLCLLPTYQITNHENERIGVQPARRVVIKVCCKLTRIVQTSTKIDLVMKENGYINVCDLSWNNQLVGTSTGDLVCNTMHILLYLGGLSSRGSKSAQIGESTKQINELKSFDVLNLTLLSVYHVSSTSIGAGGYHCTSIKLSSDEVDALDVVTL